MSTLGREEHLKGLPKNISGELLRDDLMENAKYFKTSWVRIAQGLYSVYNDRLYVAWGYEKFEYYTLRELGLKKEMALRMLKTYEFLEQEGSEYLENDFAEKKDAIHVPGCEEVNVLRLARQKKELTRDDYLDIKKGVYDKGKQASELRKELTALMKERKQVDPVLEQERKNKTSMTRFVNSIRSFNKDMEAFKLIPVEIINEAKALLKKIQAELDKRMV